MFCVSQAAPPNTVNTTLHHNPPPCERRQQSDFNLPPFHLHFLSQKKKLIFSLISVLFRSVVFQSIDASSFWLAAGKKHLSRSISFPKAFADRDRWCPFKRSHGSVLFLVLTTHTDTEPRWETHTRTDVDTQWCLHANIYIIRRA